MNNIIELTSKKEPFAVMIYVESFIDMTNRKYEIITSKDGVLFYNSMSTAEVKSFKSKIDLFEKSVDKGEDGSVYDFMDFRKNARQINSIKKTSDRLVNVLANIVSNALDDKIKNDYGLEAIKLAGRRIDEAIAEIENNQKNKLVD